MPAKRKENLELIVALAGGATVSDAAKRVGVDESTVYRALRRPAFRIEVDRMRGEVLARIAQTMIAASGRALKRLVDLLDSHDERVQLAAASRLLSAGLDWFEAGNLDRRIAALESALIDPDVVEAEETDS